MAGDRESGNAVHDGYTVVGRRPRGAAPGNIVSEKCADEFEAHSDAAESFWGDNGYADLRAQRLRRTTHDLEDDEEKYLDYQG